MPKFQGTLVEEKKPRFAGTLVEKKEPVSVPWYDPRRILPEYEYKPVVEKPKFAGTLVEEKPVELIKPTITPKPAERFFALPLKDVLPVGVEEELYKKVQKPVPMIKPTYEEVRPPVTAIPKETMQWLEIKKDINLGAKTIRDFYTFYKGIKRPAEMVREGGQVFSNLIGKLTQVDDVKNRTTLAGAMLRQLPQEATEILFDYASLYIEPETLVLSGLMKAGLRIPAVQKFLTKRIDLLEKTIVGNVPREEISKVVGRPMAQEEFTKIIRDLPDWKKQALFRTMVEKGDPIVAIKTERPFIQKIRNIIGIKQILPEIRGIVPPEVVGIKYPPAPKPPVALPVGVREIVPKKVAPAIAETLPVVPPVPPEVPVVPEKVEIPTKVVEPKIPPDLTKTALYQSLSKKTIPELKNFVDSQNSNINKLTDQLAKGIIEQPTYDSLVSQYELRRNTALKVIEDITPKIPEKPPEIKPIPKELEPLAEEARKYKSAREFVDKSIVIQQVKDAGKKYLNYDYTLKVKNINEIIPKQQLDDPYLKEDVKMFIADMKKGDIFPPIAIDKENGVIEGHRRLQAYIKQGIKKIPVIQIEKEGTGKLLNATDFYNLATKAVAKPIAWEKGFERPFAFDPNSTINEGRFRLLPPEIIEKGTYFRRKSTTPGVSYVMGKNIETGKVEVQTIRFNKLIMPEEKAIEWWEANKDRFKFYQAEAKPEVKLPPITEKPKEAIIFPTGKENVLNQIRETIKKAPGDIRFVKGVEKEIAEEYLMKEPTGKEPTTINFQIDGGFRIENTKKALWEFYKAVKKTPEKISVGVEILKRRIPLPSLKGKETLLKQFKEELKTAKPQDRPSIIHNIKELEKTIKELKPAIKRHPEEQLTTKSKEPEFLEEGQDIGLAVKKVIPESITIATEPKEIPITIEKEPKDLVGLSGWVRSWMAPVRFIAGNNPIAQKIAHLGRDTTIFMNNETQYYSRRIEKILKGITKEERQEIAKLLDRELTVKEIEVIPERIYNAYQELRIITNEMKEMVRDFKLADVEKWTIPDDAYYPHIFVGQYQILDGTKTIEGGFARRLGEALDKTKEYLEKNPTANIKIKPKDIGGEYTATLLSRKGFYRFISAVSEATELDKEEIMGLMRGVSAIKPRPKFVGNFQRRIANLEGFIDDPELAFKIYTHRIIRKKWLDPFRKKATDWALQLPPGLRQYFLEYIDDVSGKFDPFNKNYIITKNIAKITKAQSFLKLGYRPSTAFVNRLQPFHTAYSEIGNYIFLGEKFKYTKEGKEIIDLSGVKGQQPKYYALEFISESETPLWKPLGMFSKAEMANRKQVIAGGYLFARKVFEMPPDKATKIGYDYILEYLNQFKDPKIAAIEYAKDLNVDTNYIYDVSDLPKLLRKPIPKVLFQFKNYTINFLFQSSKWLRETVKNPTPHNIARTIRLIGSNVAIGGIKTPIRIAQWFMPRKIMNKILLALLLGAVAHKDERVRKVYRTVYFGVMSYLGIDISERIAPDIWIPKKPEDIFGPTASDIIRVSQDIRKGEKPLKIILRPFILGKDVYEYFKQPEGQITGYRQRMQIKANEWERWLDVSGFTPIELGIQREISKIARDEEELLKERKTVYIDQIIEAIENKEYDKKSELIKKAKSEGIIITSEQITNERIQKRKTEEQRRQKLLPKELRRKYLPFIRKK